MPSRLRDHRNLGIHQVSGHAARATIPSQGLKPLPASQSQAARYVSSEEHHRGLHSHKNVTDKEAVREGDDDGIWPCVFVRVSDVASGRDPSRKRIRTVHPPRSSWRRPLSNFLQDGSRNGARAESPL